MKKISIALLLYLLCLLPAFAANGYSTERLKQMASQLPEIPFQQLTPGVHEEFSWLHQPLVIRVNEWDEVEHIGIRTFSAQCRESSPSIVYDFLERYFLELAMMDKEKAYLRLDLDMISFEIGRMEDFYRLDENMDFKISYIGYKGYRVAWATSEEVVLCMTFVMDYQMLTGCDAIELENNFLRDIKRFHSEDSQLRKPDISPDSLSGDYFVVEGDSYLSEAIRNDLFYQKDSEGAWKLVCSTAKPYWSSANISLSDLPVGDFMLNGLLDKYGYETESFSIPMHQWIRWCEQCGGTVYFGVRSKDEEKVNGTIMVAFEDQGICHMLKVAIPLAAIAAGKGEIQGRLYVCVPLHNVCDGYFNYKRISKNVSNEKN